MDTETRQLPTLDYDTPSTAVTQILEWIEERIDLDHVAAVEERHIKALQWEAVDRPPITFSAPVSEPLALYPYSQAFHDPAMMLVNELIGPYAALGPSPSIVNSVLTDLQGPFETAVHLWGSDIFTAFYDCPDFLRALLDLLAETWALACKKFAAASTETLREDFIYLHFSIVKGKSMVKDDSTIMLSPRTYSEFIRPVNEKVVQALGPVGIHWCGNGDQWRSEVTDTTGLACLDWGNPDMIDLPAWARLLRERRLPVANMEWKASDFSRAMPTRLFPTGASFTVMTDSFEQARQWLSDSGESGNDRES